MDEKQSNGRGNADSRAANYFTLRAVVSAYLCYLGFTLLRDVLRGVSSLSAAAGWGFGLGFMAAGLVFGIYSFRRYRRETAQRQEQPGEESKTPDEEG